MKGETMNDALIGEQIPLLQNAAEALERAVARGQQGAVADDRDDRERKPRELAEWDLGEFFRNQIRISLAKSKHLLLYVLCVLYKQLIFLFSNPIFSS
jgi:hypothetical protein